MSCSQRKAIYDIYWESKILEILEINALILDYRCQVQIPEPEPEPWRERTFSSMSMFILSYARCLVSFCNIFTLKMAWLW